jgi:hypothetical protein
MFPDPNHVFGNEKGQRESQTGSMWYDSPWTKCADRDRDIGTSGVNGGAIPAHVLPFLPQAHTLVRFASLPLHLQYAFNKASAPQSTVRLRVKKGDRDKHDHLQVNHVVMLGHTSYTSGSLSLVNHVVMLGHTTYTSVNTSYTPG